MSDATPNNLKLLFQPWQASPNPTLPTVFEPAFWGKLGDLKLKDLKLSEGPLPFSAYFYPNNHSQVPGSLHIDSISADHAQEPLTPTTEKTNFSRVQCRIPGTCYCLNTIEHLDTFDRRTAISQATQAIWKSIQDGSCLETPLSLQHILVLVYCDLKKYQYHHLFAYPVLQPPTPYMLESSPPSSLSHYLENRKISCDAVMKCINTYQEDHNSLYMIIKIVSTQLSNTIHNNNNNNNTCTQNEDINNNSSQQEMHVTAHPWSITKDTTKERLASLFNTTPSSKATEPTSKLPSTSLGLLVVPDTSNSNQYPNWSLRNILYMASIRWNIPYLHVACLRTRHGRIDVHASIVLEVSMCNALHQGMLCDAAFIPHTLSGWDINIDAINNKKQTAPRIADLSPVMDPHRLATSAVDLNLQLMKWRAAPSLNIGSVSNARCLLLGAGTLGCSVARNLLGWGVRKITFVDNSKVSFSNPVRQSLFTFEDCLDGGRKKACAAADAVRRIFPAATTQGIELTIPMPGHPPSSINEMHALRDNVTTLHELIKHHDVVFLLLDTREARWLPTVACAALGKIAITAALGFDSFVVLRHGGSPFISTSGKELDNEDAALSQQVNNVVSIKSETKQGDATLYDETPPHGNITKSMPSITFSPSSGQNDTKTMNRLGCYFCNDVIAPSNSTIDRTLDQQCTVARPGLSGICGSLSVEMMASLLQHPSGINAPASGDPWGAIATAGGRNNNENTLDDETHLALGSIPHMIRGQLTGFSQMCLTGHAFSQCPACSEVVVSEYLKNGVDFVMRAVSEPHYLEDLSGLTELHRAGDAVIEAVVDAGDKKEGGGCCVDGGEGSDDWEEL